MLIIIALAAGVYVGYISAKRDGVPKGPVIKIDFLTADLGNAGLVKTPEGKFLLIDPGPGRSADALVAYLKSARVRSLDILVTNPTSSRGGALDRIVDAFEVKRVLRGEKIGTSRAWERAIDRTRGRNVPETDVASGTQISISPSTKLEVLSPPHGLLPSSRPDSDSNSIVARIVFKGKRFLFTSDIGEDAEAWLVKSGIDLESDVLVVPRGARKGGTTLEFLSRVRPEHCVVLSGRRPSGIILQRIDPKNTGAELHRTDKDGTISIVSDGLTLAVSSERDGRG
ncbi:MAG: ComEC/Rec2 family competence protein [Armatimonadota bacterium]